MLPVWLCGFYDHPNLKLIVMTWFHSNFCLFYLQEKELKILLKKIHFKNELEKLLFFFKIYNAVFTSHSFTTPFALIFRIYILKTFKLAFTKCLWYIFSLIAFNEAKINDTLENILLYPKYFFVGPFLTFGVTTLANKLEEVEHWKKLWQHTLFNKFGMLKRKIWSFACCNGIKLVHPENLMPALY